MKCCNNNTVESASARGKPGRSCREYPSGKLAEVGEMPDEIAYVDQLYFDRFQRKHIENRTHNLNLVPLLASHPTQHTHQHLKNRILAPTSEKKNSPEENFKPCLHHITHRIHTAHGKRHTPSCSCSEIGGVVVYPFHIAALLFALPATLLTQSRGHTAGNPPAPPHYDSCLHPILPASTGVELRPPARYSLSAVYSCAFLQNKSQ